MRFRKFWAPMLVLGLVQAAAAQNPERIQLVGVGTTSVLTVYSKWFQEFEKIHPEVHFVYIPNGSGTGIELGASGRADFGGTDVPVTDKQLAKAKVLQVATLLVAIVPIYNLPGLSRPLKFSPQALAGIYLGTITQWNDAAISAPNPDVQLPASTIVVFHSVAGRGSTYIWSDYLSKVSLEWKTKIGRGIDITFPVGKGAEANGNLARMVKETPNSIGYVELNYARRSELPSGQVQNAAGSFISADVSSVTAAASAAAKSKPTDFRGSITNAPGDRSYPICSFTWILASENPEQTTKQQAMKDFLRWMLDEGQTQIEPAGFARLPRAIVEQEQRAIEKIP